MKKVNGLYHLHSITPHYFLPKGWGNELWIHNDQKYCGKVLSFEKGKRCSLHYHKVKHETFHLESGLVLIRGCPVDDVLIKGVHIDELEWIEFRTGDSMEIPPYTIHQVKAIEKSKLYEFSTQHFESDSYRIVKGD